MNILSSCTSGGCGAKIGSGELLKYLKDLPRNKDPRLLVGFDSSDDAAVWKISEDEALVSTTDFFSPMVDDPYLFGRIAAANALSDVYAMGAKPVLALNLVCFPKDMDPGILALILKGGAEKVSEAGAVIGGGHSIYDHEIKYGLSVTGLVHPLRVFYNNIPCDGDALILTKALGIGLIMSAYRAKVVAETEFETATAVMERLNRYAFEKLDGFEVHAVTDVTGYSFLGHLCEMAGENHTMAINFDSLPLLPGALTYASEFLGTAAGQLNRNHVAPKVELVGITAAAEEILFDPQTSGGLLISVSAKEAEDLCANICKDDPMAAIVGQVMARENSKTAVMVL